jgi:sulfate transport system ATP-binding protein
MAGLEFPDTGTVRFDGQDVTGLKVKDRGVGIVFQHYALFRHMSVAENVAFGLRVRKRRDRPQGTEIDRRVQELLDLVQLGDKGARLPSQLSGGQRQRIALARALAVDPKLLLLDEPFGALDAKVRKGLRRWLRELHNRMGLTSIFVTHDQDEAFALADRVVVMQAGRIEQVGPPAAVWHRPANEFVARFLGFATIVDATVDGDVVHSPWGLLATADLVGGRDAITATPTVVRLAARPDTLRLTGGGPVRGVVSTTTFRRDHFLVRVDTEFGPFDVAAEDAPVVDTATSVGVDPTGLVVLPA